MKANEEITFCYFFENYSDYRLGTKQLKEYWNLDCTCSLCKKRLLGPTGGLRDKALAIGDMTPPEADRSIQHIEQSIGEMISKGFDYWSHLMRELHRLRCLTLLAPSGVLPFSASTH